MVRGRLIALHALALTMTIATMTVVTVASSPYVKWVVVALGGVAAIASLAFARSALREIERLTERTAQLESRKSTDDVTPGEHPRLLH